VRRHRVCVELTTRMKTTAPEYSGAWYRGDYPKPTMYTKYSPPWTFYNNNIYFSTKKQGTSEEGENITNINMIYVQLYTTINTREERNGLSFSFFL